MTNKVTIHTAAEFIRTQRAPPELRQLLLTNTDTFNFEAERANRPPRFIEVVNDYKNGIPVDTISVKYQCSRNTVLRYARLAGLSKRPKAFTPERREQVITLYKSNLPIKEIAAVVGVSVAYVSKTAVEVGINRRNFK